MLVSRFAFKRDFGAQVITGFSFSYGNAILLGLPLALLTFGEKGAFPFFILLAFHALAAFTVTTIALEYGRSEDLSIKLTSGLGISIKLTNERVFPSIQVRKQPIAVREFCGTQLCKVVHSSAWLATDASVNKIEQLSEA